MMILWVLLQSLACTTFAQFETADQLQISIVPSISFNSSSGTFTYLFQVTSASSSVQVLNKLILVTLDAKTSGGGTISQVFTPINITNWKETVGAANGLHTNIINWFPIHTKSENDPELPPSHDLQPGQSANNLGLVSGFLPGPTTFYAQGWVKPPTQDEIDAKLSLPPAGEPSGKQLQSVYPGARPIGQNSFHDITIGPMQSPAGLTPAALVDRLASLKHQALTLGWISGPGADGVVQSLDAKLTAAKAALARGDVKAAEGQLTAFINELEAQRGKHLNDDAYFMLKANAQFILAKLGP